MATIADRQFLDGFGTAAQTIASDTKAFTLTEMRRALGYEIDRAPTHTRRDGCCAWLSGFDAGIRAAYGE
jgi:hypothetical protein